MQKNTHTYLAKFEIFLHFSTGQDVLMVKPPLHMQEVSGLFVLRFCGRVNSIKVMSS